MTPHFDIPTIDQIFLVGKTMWLILPPPSSF